MRQVLADLERHEGYRFYAYPDQLSKLYRANPKLKWGFFPAKQLMPAGTNWNDGNPWTVGIGYTPHVTVDSTMSHEEAVEKTRLHVVGNMQELEMVWPTWDEQSFVTQTVLINMCYNMGISTLDDFKNSMKYLLGKDYEMAAANFRKSLWFQQTGSRAREMVERIEKQRIRPEYQVS